MQNQDFTLNAFLKTLNIIHLGFLAAMIAFAGISYTLNIDEVSNWYDLNDVFLYVLPFIMLSSLSISVILYKKQIAALDHIDGLKEKLEGLQAAMLVRFALVESPALFAIVCFFLSNSLIYIIIAVILMLVFLMLKPSAAQIIRDLKLEGDLKKKFEHGDEGLK